MTVSSPENVSGKGRFFCTPRQIFRVKPFRMDLHSNIDFVIWGYFILMNIAAFIAFYIDKKRAQKNARRISEATLLGLAFFGGSGGAMWAMDKFRHKTQKQPFKGRLYAISLLHVGLIIVFLSPLFRAG